MLYVSAGEDGAHGTWIGHLETTRPYVDEEKWPTMPRPKSPRATLHPLKEVLKHAHQTTKSERTRIERLKAAVLAERCSAEESAYSLPPRNRPRKDKLRCRS
ncbi:hypothetical protein Tb09.244.1960 [Trypanosoma brucei brucei TREU927]|uniref:Uncharacterized protein n=1 Tax=Trypanosoma brucei brucei (strain 927/4 GUTat10.1) TaxID=185431 RepID=Q38CR3_TRYB2|nr:hypothetical protein Tb09.244.1960 [Trypanosoma brucei brucei TREU927]EAN77407.1 hypothetical protein Tb09.244.1960 [Trypanosoma brucei brucei TREU927]